MANLHQLLKAMIEKGASDLHVTTNAPPQLRIDGRLHALKLPPLAPPETKQLCYSILTDSQKHRFEESNELDLSFGVRGLARFRANIFMQRGAVSGAFRAIPFKINTIDELGLPRVIHTLAEKPRGLILVTGPTGSGKSTTLYCCLNLINSPDENIVTVEDPVEYKFRGLNQVHVRSNVGLTFASALRAFLRQDPDRIMVGEVRDQETAQICLRAALTGHLVVSTLHTNTALQVVNRLTDMGIEPFLLGPALRLLEAQRLTRRLCKDCKQPMTLPDDVARRHGLETGLELFGPGTGECETCSGNRYKGRVGLYEVVPIGETLRELIAQGKPETVLMEAARAEGARFLDDAARQALRAGHTSLAEVAEYISVSR